MAIRSLSIPRPARPAVSAPETGAVYNPAIDYLRFAAALGVVLFHGGAIGRYGGELPVAFFTIALCYFTLQKRQSGATQGRVWRFLWLWLIWTAIYAALKAAQSVQQGIPAIPDLLDWLPPAGHQGHLWFLPFAALISALVTLVPVRRMGRNWVLPGLVALALCSFATSALAASALLPPMLRLFALYLPSVFLGVLLFAARGDARALLLLSAVSVATGLALWAAGSGGYLQLLFGAPVTAAAMRWPPAALPGSRVLGKLSLHVYLVHMMALVAVNTATPFHTATVAGAALAVVLSILGAMAVSLTQPAPRR